MRPRQEGIEMTYRTTFHKMLKWSAGAFGLATATYAGCVARAWTAYGHPSAPHADDADSMLDRFIPVYDVAERHHVHVAAPAHITFAAACEADPNSSAIIRGIFRSREKILGSEADETVRPRGLLALTTSMGWGVLAEVPGREIVVGAVTQPWKANVVFRTVAPDEFAAFAEPDYVKIVWTLRADAIGEDASVFRTETRAVATDASARRTFRR